MPTPQERAEYLYARLKEVEPDATYWDLICFTGLIFGSLSHAELSLQDVALDVARRLMLLNDYNNGDEIATCLPPKSKTPPQTSDDTNTTPT